MEKGEEMEIKAEEKKVKERRKKKKWPDEEDTLK